MSSCVHRNKSKCCIALPADADFVRIFQKTLIGGFSCITTRLAFDRDVLVDDPDKEKVIIELNISGKKQLKRFSSKILKIDEKNQYGQAMTKPLPYGCIRKMDKVPTMTTKQGIFSLLTLNFMISIKKHCGLMKFIRQYFKKVKK